MRKVGRTEECSAMAKGSRKACEAVGSGRGIGRKSQSGDAN